MSSEDTSDWASAGAVPYHPINKRKNEELAVPRRDTTKCH